MISITPAGKLVSAATTKWATQMQLQVLPALHCQLDTRLLLCTVQDVFFFLKYTRNFIFPLKILPYCSNFIQIFPIFPLVCPEPYNIQFHWMPPKSNIMREGEKYLPTHFMQTMHHLTRLSQAASIADHERTASFKHLTLAQVLPSCWKGEGER